MDEKGEPVVRVGVRRAHYGAHRVQVDRQWRVNGDLVILGAVEPRCLRRERIAFGHELGLVSLHERDEEVQHGR